MLSQHPKSTRGASKNNTSNVAYIAAGATFLNPKIFSVFLLQFFLPIFFLQFSKFIGIRLQNVVILLFRLFVINIESFAAFGQFDVYLIAAKVLHTFVKRGVIFISLKRIPFQVICYF